MDRTAPLRSRLTRLALAWVVAFVAIAMMTVAGSATTTAQAAAPAIGCDGPERISVTAPDGSERCVENTCEAVLGVEGRASECTQGAGARSINTSVPEAGETGAGVAPVAVASQPAAARTAAASANDVSMTQVLTWASALLGLAAALAAGGLYVSGRRARVERETGTRAPAA